ncbi:7743_t:CDS:2, partial [Scutellospora calospora]
MWSGPPSLLTTTVNVNVNFISNPPPNTPSTTPVSPPRASPPTHVLPALSRVPCHGSHDHRYPLNIPLPPSAVPSPPPHNIANSVDVVARAGHAFTPPPPQPPPLSPCHP